MLIAGGEWVAESLSRHLPASQTEGEQDKEGANAQAGQAGIFAPAHHRPQHSHHRAVRSSCNHSDLQFSQLMVDVMERHIIPGLPLP